MWIKHRFLALMKQKPFSLWTAKQPERLRKPKPHLHLQCNKANSNNSKNTVNQKGFFFIIIPAAEWVCLLQSPLQIKRTALQYVPVVIVQAIMSERMERMTRILQGMQLILVKYKKKNPPRIVFFFFFWIALTSWWMVAVWLGYNCWPIMTRYLLRTLWFLSKMFHTCTL